MNTIEFNGSTFSGTEIVSATVNSEISLVGDTLAADAFSAKVKSSLTGETHVYTSLMEWYSTCDDEYYYVDDGDLTEYKYGDPLIVKKDGALYEQFYATRVTRSGQQLFNIESKSGMGLLVHQTHVGGVYQAEPAGNIIEDIMANSGVPYDVIDSAVANTPVSGWLPYGNKRDNLQQILFAIGANVRKGANGNVQFVYYKPEEAKSISDRIITRGGEDKHIAPATKIVLTEHAYFAGASSEYETVFTHNGTSADHAVAVFDGPVIPSSIRGKSGSTIVIDPDDYGANYCVYSGSGEIEAIRYTHTTTDLIWEGELLDEENTKTYRDATLITALNSRNVLNRLKKYYVDANQYDMSFSVTTEKPGDYITFSDAFNRQRSGFIKKLNVYLSGRNKGVAEIMTEWYPSDTGSTFVRYELYQSEGTITVPPEAVGKPARLVLMGGFKGGSSGTAGESGTGNSASASSPYYYVNPGTGGQTGGEGGDGGLGVMILTIDIPSMPSSFSIDEIGAGGAGGARVTTYGADSNEGSLGGDTEITISGTTYSTADEDAEENTSGFANIIDGTFYNYPGKDGYTCDSVGGDGHKDRFGDRGGSFMSWTGGKQGKGWNYGWSTTYGGGGGGAAYGANGLEGGDASQGSSGSGGNGATSVTPGQASFGHCGDGGHGGAPGGGAGGGYIYYGAAWYPSSGGRGGNGSAGGQGSNGGVLAYYGG